MKPSDLACVLMTTIKLRQIEKGSDEKIKSST